MLAPRRGTRAKYWPRLELNFQWTPCPPRVAPQVIMSSSRKSDKEVATPSQKKRSQSGNIPLAPAVPRGQTRGSLAREFRQILRWIRELGREFIFAKPKECNLHIVREFYANWAPEARFHYVMNIRAIVKSAMRKVRVHKGHMYAFGGLITKMCRIAGVPKEQLDYMAPLYPASVDITQTKGPYTEFGPTITMAEHHRRDELIMARMYGLEMLRNQNGCHASTNMDVGEVERRYPLNDHARALLGIGPEFREPIEIDILTDEENLRTGSGVDSDSEEEIDAA
uniref:Uncharacterized protein n=1 Tax=Solanum tuberosum TaxID=4113 RepID=M1DHJ7_SOLTU